MMNRFIFEETISAHLIKEDDSDSQDERGDTPLHYAVRSGNQSLADLFVNGGANVDSKNKARDAPLHKAVVKQYMDLIELLISSKCNVNLQNKAGFTPLHIAIKENVEFSIVRRLVCAGADVNVKDNQGRTPLHLAIEVNADVSTISYLLDNYNMDKESDVNESICVDESPLFPALNHSNSEFVTKLLLDKGFKANVQDFYRRGPLHFLDNHTKKETVELLLDHGHEIDVKEINGWTPLFVAVRFNNIPVVGLLLNRGADVNTHDNMYCFPLLPASASKNVAMLERLLLEKTLNIDQSTDRGHTAIHQAVLYNNIPVVDLLLRKGCNVNLQDYEGHSPLFLAIMYGCLEILDILLDESICDVNQRDVKGNTPLSVATQERNEYEVYLLLRYGARVNVQNMDGRTPLHNAVNRGYSESVKLLLEAGARVDVYDNSGKTPLDLATFNKEEIVKMFEEIKKLKSKKLNGVPLYKVFSNQKNPMFTDNVKMEAFINSDWLRIEFPIFSGTLKQLFLVAKRRKSLLNSINFNVRIGEGDMLQEIQLPNELTREIMCYLTDKELRHFKQACE